VLIETPPGMALEISAHLQRFLIMEDAAVLDVSAFTGCIALQGPGSRSVIQTFGATAKSSVVVAADHTGSGGFDIYSTAEQLTNGSAAVPADVISINDLAQEILRIEAGIPKYGVDMDLTTLAPEAGLVGSHVSLTKGCYVGQEIVARIDSRGHTNRSLTGFVLHGASVPILAAKLYPLDDESDTRDVGWITSIAPSAPSYGDKSIALGYLRHEHRSEGTRVRVSAPENNCTAEVVALPFYRASAL